MNQSENGESWISVVKFSIDSGDTQFFYDADENPYILNCDEVIKVQHKERWTKVVKDMLAGKGDVRKVERRQLPHKACVLLWDCPNLLVDDKGLLS